MEDEYTSVRMRGSDGLRAHKLTSYFSFSCTMSEAEAVRMMTGNIAPEGSQP